MDACVVVNFLLKTDGVVDGDRAWGDDAGVDDHVLVKISYHMTQNCSIFGNVVIDATGDLDATWTGNEKLNEFITVGCCFAFSCQFRVSMVWGFENIDGQRKVLF